MAGLPFDRAMAASGDYATFLAGVRREAEGKGVPASIVRRALALTTEPNAKVIRLDHHQPEFSLTWAQYRDKVLSAAKVAAGKEAVKKNHSLFQEISSHYGVDVEGISGIWGLESFYGRITGGFYIVDALATLAFEGRRASFFRSELMKALQILGDGEIAPEEMKGSYAGAMGQPQFMPSAYLTYAQSFPAGGAKDIWNSVPDVLASIANYLARCGWKQGEPWGQEIQVPEALPQADLGRKNERSLGAWMKAGVRRADGSAFARTDISGAVLRPDGAGGQAFMVYHNFNVFRRYNPSDFYALAAGLLGNMTA